MTNLVLPTGLAKPTSTANPYGGGAIPYNPAVPDPFGSFAPGTVTSDKAGTPVATTAVTTAGATTGGVTAASTHQAIVAILIMAVFVYLMVLLAGTSPAAGKIISTLFIGLLLIQGATHVNPFVEWVNKHPLTPTT
jgi:hypothetical protein